MLHTVILAIGVIYFLIVLTTTIGMFRLPKSVRLEDDKLPTVSIIISARNEESDIPKCIKALEKIDYPKERFQVVLVDDRSTDSTGSIIAAAVSKNPNFFKFNTTDFPETKLKAKARGIALGISKSEGEWIFITDADAEAPSGWLRHMLSKTNEKTGMIGGMLSVKQSSILSFIERSSWAYVLPFAFGLAGWGSPFACIGPNIAIRRSIYENAGGLEEADFELAEDLALFKMVEKSDYHSISYMSEETTINLNPVSSYNHLFSQQRRWLKGGFEAGWEYVIGLISAFLFSNIVSTLVIFGWWFAPFETLILVLLKSSIDFLLLMSERHLIKKAHILRYFIFFEIYIVFAFFWHPLSFLFSRKIKWKGEGFEIEYE